MAVIGLIAAILTPGLVGQLGRARAKTAQMQLETISAGVEMFRADVGRYPTDAEGLAALMSDPSDTEGWTGPYLRDRKVLKDPWGGDVDYKVEGGGLAYAVKSLGADRKEGGAAMNRDLTAPSQ